MLSLAKFSKDLNCKNIYSKTNSGRFVGYEKRVASTNLSIANSKFTMFIR